MSIQVVTIRMNTSFFILLLALMLMAASMYNCSLRNNLDTLPTLSPSNELNLTHTLSESNHSPKLIHEWGLPPSTTPMVASVLHGCGQICELNITGTPSLFFNFIRKDFECAIMWSNPVIDESRIGPPIPLDQLPLEFLNHLTFNAAVPIRPYGPPMDQAYLGGTASLPVWEAETIHEWSMQCARGFLDGNYGRSETSSLLRGLLQVPHMETARVLVIGSENPWVEACVLAAGSTDVTTLEYGRIDSRHPYVKTITPPEIRERYNDLMETFDVIVTFSSVEHAGLGRYGDALNPWGDRQAIARAWCATKPGGYLVIGVPYGDDAVEYNAHRIYGPIMYPHLVANWYQQWRAESGNQRVHVLRKSIDGLSDPGHTTPPKAFCLVGSLYGQSNNQILAISWARMLASKLNLSLLLTFTDGPDYLFINWASTFGSILGIRWGGVDEIEACHRTMSWHDAFHEMLAQRASVPDDKWPLVIPLHSVRAQARLLWNEKVLAHGSYMTVHGRSFENTIGQCLSSEHSGYACEGEHLCDYRLNVVIDRFGQFFNTTINPKHIVLFTDGQNPEYARGYPVVESDGNLFVHMWIMVLSRIHIAHPGSTVDYVIWRWRQSLHHEDGQHRFMLPWNCYNNHSFHG